MSKNSQEFLHQIKELMEQNQKIEAIKVYRKQTNAGLKDAKDAVEALAQGEMPPSLVMISRSQPTQDQLEAEIARRLEQETLIPVTKYYREQTGCGLKDAKAAVELIAENQCIDVKSGMGCLGMILLALVLGNVAIACLVV